MLRFDIYRDDELVTAVRRDARELAELQSRSSHLTEMGLLALQRRDWQALTSVNEDQRRVDGRLEALSAVVTGLTVELVRRGLL